MSEEKRDATDDAFYFSENEELFTDGPFASREEAIEEARGTYNHFYTAMAGPIWEPDFDGSRVIEDIQEQRDEELGEECTADGWPEHTDEQATDLEKRLKAVLMDWLTETGNTPKAFTLLKSEEHDFEPKEG